jgi:hypothetical protein
MLLPIVKTDAEVDTGQAGACSYAGTEIRDGETIYIFRATFQYAMLEGRTYAVDFSLPRHQVRQADQKAGGVLLGSAAGGRLAFAELVIPAEAGRLGVVVGGVVHDRVVPPHDPARLRRCDDADQQPGEEGQHEEEVPRALSRAICGGWFLRHASLLSAWRGDQAKRTLAHPSQVVAMGFDMVHFQSAARFRDPHGLAAGGALDSYNAHFATLS